MSPLPKTELLTETMCQQCRRIVFAVDSRLLCLGCQIIEDLTEGERHTLKAVRAVSQSGLLINVRMVAEEAGEPQSTTYSKLKRLKQKKYVTWRFYQPGTIRLTDRRVQ